ncbi:MerR family transcriptional regulator [Streptomyces sp. NPDC001380]|uniref:MerR family transcriptional regulator n=1 Tax=Streptomyces sp. NPDC001380 TaxID=3364566 RepID=UPI00368C8D07
MAVARPITPITPTAPAAAPRASAAAEARTPPPASAEPDATPRHTIGEAAARSGLSVHTLRWYERIGLLDPIDRSYSGQRRYSDRDLGWLAFLGKLRLTGMPVADMVRYAELVRAGGHTSGERLDLLRAHREEVRQRISDLQATLAVLDHKIDLYSDAARAAEGNRTA